MDELRNTLQTVRLNLVVGVGLCVGWSSRLLGKYWSLLIDKDTLRHKRAIKTKYTDIGLHKLPHAANGNTYRVQPSNNYSATCGRPKSQP